MKRSVVVLLLVTLVPLGLHAEEGMWLPFQIDKAPFREWQEHGLQISPEELYNEKAPDVSDAIVRLGGGTGSFVSPDGLVMTNHHVAFRALQRQSSLDANIMEDGFLARTRAEEISAPGYKAYVLKRVEDVTDEILKHVKSNMTDSERFMAIDRAEKKLIEKAEKGKDVYAKVEAFYGSSEFHLFTYFEIKDVRIVYAPPHTIGVYGGEIDNWMWPRHTGDFSFLRAYVGPDGKSAEYASDNIPYKPEHHLPISVAPLHEGDFTMVIGYPYHTSRYTTSYGIHHYVTRYYPDRLEQYGDLLDILDGIAAENADAAIKVAGTRRGLANSYKNNMGMLEGLKKHDLYAKKVDEEKSIRRYLQEHPEMADVYGTVLDDIGAQYTNYETYGPQLMALKRLVYFTTALRSAHTVAKWAHEQEKKDIDRDAGYQDRDLDRVRQQLELAEKSYDETADPAILTYYLSWLLAHVDGSAIKSLPQDVTAASDREAAIDAFVAGCYANTRVTDTETVLGLMSTSWKELGEMDDAMLDFAMALVVEEDELDDRYEAYQGAMKRLAPRMFELRAMASGRALYPDANGTKRISTGEIRGYVPRDAVVYKPFTTLSGVVDKYTGEEPFDLPDRLIELSRAKDYGGYADPAFGDVPVCFLSTDDVTGGNSGSPVLNGKGEAIGLVFDGNYEAISADFQFIPELTRTIHVDCRYMLWVIEKLAGATELLNEMTIVGNDTEGAMR